MPKSTCGNHLSNLETLPQVKVHIITGGLSQKFPISHKGPITSYFPVLNPPLGQSQCPSVGSGTYLKTCR